MIDETDQLHADGTEPLTPNNSGSINTEDWNVNGGDEGTVTIYLVQDNGDGKCTAWLVANVPTRRMADTGCTPVGSVTFTTKAA